MKTEKEEAQDWLEEKKANLSNYLRLMHLMDQSEDEKEKIIDALLDDYSKALRKWNELNESSNLKKDGN